MVRIVGAMREGRHIVSSTCDFLRFFDEKIQKVSWEIVSEIFGIPGLCPSLSH